MNQRDQELHLAREAEHGAQPALGARPELCHDVASGVPHDVREHERNEQRIVELTEYWDEIRDQVDWRNQIRNEEGDRELRPPRHAPVA